MKTVLYLLIAIYQNVLSPFMSQLAGTNNVCRFTPTCSEYARISIKEKGMIVGLYLSLARLLKCQPYYKFA